MIGAESKTLPATQFEERLFSFGEWVIKDDITEATNNRPLQSKRTNICVACGYNLHGLTFDHRCPECGKPAAESVQFRIKQRAPKNQREAEILKRSRAALQLAAKDAPYPSAAFIFIARSISFATMQAKGQHVTALDVCRAVRDYAKYSLGGQAQATLILALMKIKRSEDVGDIVDRLVKAGRFVASESDSLDQFNNVFTLENLFEVPM